MLDTFSDNNDYTSFPDYESELGIGFEKLTRFAPSQSVSLNVPSTPHAAY